MLPVYPRPALRQRKPLLPSHSFLDVCRPKPRNARAGAVLSESRRPQLPPSPRTEYLASAVLTAGRLSAPPAELLFPLMPPVAKTPRTLRQDSPVS